MFASKQTKFCKKNAHVGLVHVNNRNKFDQKLVRFDQADYGFCVQVSSHYAI